MQNHIIQGNFTCGELSPLLVGRADTEMFFSGASELYNCSVLTQGGIERRPGSKSLNTFRRHSSAVRLFKMQITEDEAYLLQMTDYSIYVINAMTNVLVTEITSHPYMPEEFAEITYHQSVDVLYLAHRNHPLGKVSNYGGSDWRYEAVELSNGPFLDVDATEEGIQLSVGHAEDRMTVTSSLPDYAGFTVGGYIEYRQSGVPLLGQIVSKISDYSVLIEPLEDKCITPSKEIFSPGTYFDWNGDDGTPKYRPILDVTTEQRIAFSAMNVLDSDSVGKYIRFSDQFGVFRWLQVNSIDDILQMGSYGIIGVGPILRVAVTSSFAVQTTTNRAIRARMYCSRNNFFARSQDAGRSYRLQFGETTVYAKVLPDISKPITVTGTLTANSTFIAASDLTGIYEGMQASCVGLPAGAFITKVQPYVPPIPVYEVSKATSLFTNVLGTAKSRTTFAVTGLLAPLRTQTKVKNNLAYTIPAIPSGFYVSYAATESSTNATITLGDSTETSTNSVLVMLSRTVPTGKGGYNLYNGGTADRWWKGAFFIGNYPGLVGVHQERLVLASSNLQPQTVWLSNTGDYTNFSPVNEQSEALDSNAITVTIGSPQLNRISWLSTKDVLCFGTTGGEWVLSSGSQRLPLTPRNVTAVTQSPYGSVYNARVDVGRDVLFLQTGGFKLRQLHFDIQTDGYVSKDLTIRSDHILRKFGGGIDIALSQNPNTRVFMLCNSGDILALTYDTAQEVYAWSHYCDCSTKSMCIVQRGSEDIMYLSVLRVINDGGQQYLSTCLEEINLTNPVAYLDCHRYIGGTSSVTDQAYTNQYVVFTANGQNSDPVLCDLYGHAEAPSGFAQASDLYVGLPYTTRVETFPLEAQSQLGPGLGRFQSIVYTIARLHNSGGFVAGVSHYINGSSRTVERSLRTYGSSMDKTAPNRTDDVELRHAPGIGPRQTIFLSTDRPWPLTILALCHHIEQK